MTTAVESGRTAVKSSNVKSVGYDPASRKLQVEFHAAPPATKGVVYEYGDVTPGQHAALMAAKSKGAYLHLHISHSSDHPAKRV